MRKNIVAGNWKMNNDATQTTALINDLNNIQVSEKLKEIYPGRIRVSDPINPPKSCLNYNKKRYRADSLIRYFRRRS